MDNTTNTEAPAPSVAAPVKKPSCKGKVTVAAIIAALVGGGIASGVFLTINAIKGQSDYRGEVVSSSSTLENVAIKPFKDENGNEEINKGIILDARLTAELAYKTNRIIAGSASSERTISYMDTTGTMADYVNLSDDNKTQIVMRKVDWNTAGVHKKYAELPDNSEVKANKDIASLYADGATVIYIDDNIKSDYKYLFDSELTAHPDVADSFDVGACFLQWDDKNNFYYNATQCGGGTSIGHSLYQYKYELDGDKAYVYLAIVSYDDSNETYYSGFINDGNVLNLTASQKQSLGNNLRASENIYDSATNTSTPLYKKLAHYRAVFERGSDKDFYYKTIEKVND